MLERDSEGRIVQRLTDDEALALARFRTAGRLVRGAVHDTRNAVGSVAGNLEWAASWHDTEQARIAQIEQALGPYARPGELHGAATAFLDRGRADRDELRDVLDECAMGVAQAIEAGTRLRRSCQEAPLMGAWELTLLVEDAVGTARLFSKNGATWDVQVPEGVSIRGERTVWDLLLTSVMLAPLERLASLGRKDALQVHYDGDLHVTDGLDGEVPFAARIAAERLGVDLSRADGRTTLRHAPG